jgi:hypothetical protein
MLDHTAFYRNRSSCRDAYRMGHVNTDLRPESWMRNSFKKI